MKKTKSGPKEGKGEAPPAQLIDARIKELSDWWGETLARDPNAHPRGRPPCNPRRDRSTRKIPPRLAAALPARPKVLAEFHAPICCTHLQNMNARIVPRCAPPALPVRALRFAGLLLALDALLTSTPCPIMPELCPTPRANSPGFPTCPERTLGQ